MTETDDGMLIETVADVPDPDDGVYYPSFGSTGGRPDGAGGGKA